MNNATKDGANLIQSLSTLGILEIDAKQLKSAAPNSTRNYQLPDRKVKADELNASDSKLRQTPVLLRPHTQPSLFWKALASTIAPLITNATNLTDEDMALFLSTPTQAGIPGGEFVPREITNFQIFSKADAVQKLDHPGFSLEGASYFSMLASFFRNLTSDSDSSSINIAREALLRATEAKNKAWKNAFSAYEDKIRNGVDSPPFTEFLNNNVEYSQAWELERQMQAAYTDLQGSDMEVISRQIDILKASDNRLSSSKFGNMPCTVMSDDYIRYALLNRNQTIKVDKETIFYRPLYWLPNWEMHVNHWANSKKTSYKYKIDFSHLSEVTWESFGHKGLDTAAAPELTNDQYNLLQQLKGTLTFFGKPVVVDIERGHWDVKGFRHGARLSQRAPEAIKQKFCKTSKFLLSWGFEIEIILPDKVGTKSVEDISLAFLRVPAAVSENGKVLKFTTERTNYPWLMASLASVV